MAREIKTRLTLDGEKEFKQQIASINRELRLGNAQLKETAAAYDLNGNAQEQLASKSKILKAQLDAQNRIVAEYEKRMKQAEKSTDLSADGLRNYEIALTNARTKQKQLEKQVEDTDKELEELGRDSRRAGKQLEDNLGDAADEVSGKFSKMVQNIDSSLKSIKGMQGVSLAVDLVKGAWNIGSQAYQWAQGYAEENMKTAMTQYNVETAGGNWAQTSKLAIQYASIFGDKDSALEAISNLVQAGYTGDQLETVAQYLGGAAIRWQDTLKIESLADSLQESIATGVLTGQFAELISRLEKQTGITQEQAQAQLTEAKKYGNELDVVEAYMRNAGLETTYQGFTDQNKAMVDAAVAAGELNQELANLAKEVNIAITPAEQLLATEVSKLNEKIKEIVGADDPGAEAAKTVVEAGVTVVDKTVEAIYKAAGGETGGNPYAGKKAIPAVTAYVDEQIAKMQAEEKRTTPEGKRRQQAIWIASSQDLVSVGKRFGEVSESIKTETDLAAETATEGGVKIGTSLWSGMQAQTSQLIAIAQQQRALLEAVWNDPITPTVVVSYGTAPGATGGKPNLPTLPESVSVTVELDKRKLGQTIVPLVDQALGGAAGADVDKIY